MAEMGPRRMLPMKEKPWDKKGVSALKALTEYHRNPKVELMGELALKQNATDKEKSDANELARARKADVKQHFTRLERRVKKSCELISSKSLNFEEEARYEESLDALTDIYETLCESRQLRSYAAHKRLLTEEEIKDKKTPFLIKLYYVGFPCFMFMFCFAIQSVLLHLATHFYVYQITSTEKEFGNDKNEVPRARLFDLIGNSVGAWATPGGHDKVGAIDRGKANIPTPVLDASGAIPLGLCVTAYVYSYFKGQFSIGLWNKTFIVASCMAILKGVFDVVTILPDSSGWETCKARLGDGGVQRMQELKFEGDTVGAFFKLFFLEFFGENGRRIRYCADMMVSGHTYFAALFSIAAYKQTWYAGVDRRIPKAVGVICAFCLCMEVVLVAAARFHYTVDMLAAIVLVGILYDSTYVEQIAADWSEGFRWREPDDDFKVNSSPFFNRVLKLWRSWSTSSKLPAMQKSPESKNLLDKNGVAAEVSSAEGAATTQSDSYRIIASRSMGLVNPRVTQGHPPWTWHTFEDLEGFADKADVEEKAAEDRQVQPSELSTPAQTPKSGYEQMKNTNNGDVETGDSAAKTPAQVAPSASGQPSGQHLEHARTAGLPGSSQDKKAPPSASRAGTSGV